MIENKELVPLKWTNSTRKLSQLNPWEFNPKQITQENAERLAESPGLFGQVQTLAIEPDDTIVDGHSRFHVWRKEFGPDYEVDVRVSNRKLTEEEKRMLTIYMTEGTHGDWDMDMLAGWGEEIETLTDWGMPAWKLGVIKEEEPPDDFPEFDEGIETNRQCPKCGYQWNE